MNSVTTLYNIIIKLTRQIIHLSPLRKIKNLIEFVWIYIISNTDRPYSTDYEYQSNLIHNAPKVGHVLDIASGHNPFKHATILSDRYFEITKHRHQEITLDNRPFLLLDIHDLPFADKSIDYIYCSHVIEHVDDPLKACLEMMRVGKAGYIETPTLAKDMLFSWAREMGHQWHLVRINERLVFFEYDERRQNGVQSKYWKKKILGIDYDPLQDIFYPNQDIFNTHLEWNDKFEVSVYYLNRPPVHLNL